MNVKISWAEVRKLEDYIQGMEDQKDQDPDFLYTTDFWSFFAENPHFLFPMGFDEYVCFANRKDFRDLWFAESVDDCGQSLYRTPNGQWLLLAAAATDRFGSFAFHSKTTWDAQNREPWKPPAREVLESL
jgi:hypothetical protein